MPQVGGPSRPKIDRKGNDRESDSAEARHGARHMAGRCDEEPTFARSWSRDQTALLGILTDITRPLLHFDPTRFDPKLHEQITGDCRFGNRLIRQHVTGSS